MAESSSSLIHPRFRPRTVAAGLLAWWAWQRRRELAGWAGYVKTAPQRVRNGERTDVIAEARLRLKLGADPATRGLRGLTVRNGVAHLDPRDEDLPITVAGIHARSVGIDTLSVDPPEVVLVPSDPRARV